MRTSDDRRRYIRHPVSVPIDVEFDGKHINGNTNNISQGGLLFCYKEQIPHDTPITIVLPNPDAPEKMLRFSGQVVRSEYNAFAEQYDIGIAFFSPDDAHKVRMVEQILLIEAYRRQQNLDDFNKAALEWIERYSENFPQL